MRARFVPNPFRGTDGGDLLYYTGDRGRYRPDGALELLGRLDDQLKIRGVRVEPAEVKAALEQHAAVRACFITGRKDAQGDDSLVAYLVCDPGRQPGREDLRGYLSARLPSALVPSAWHYLDELPRLANGKVDRSALPVQPAVVCASEAAHAAPRTPLEATLVELWREVLCAEHIGIHDNFFDVGGHSLKAMQLASRIQRALDVAVPLRRIFEAPTIAQLSATLGHVAPDSDNAPLERFLEELERMSDEDARRQLNDHRWNRRLPTDVPP
jgi:acyl carrier protein